MAVALPFIALAASAGGSLLGGISSARNAAFQAQVARNNAQIASQNQAYTAGAAAASTEKAGLEARQQFLMTRAAGAANNLDVNTGSEANTQTSERLLGKLDQSTTASQGAERVYGYAAQATGFEGTASAEQAQVVPDILGGVLGAVGKVAGGVPDLPSGGGGGGTSLSADQLPSNYTTDLGNYSMSTPTIAETGGGGSSTYDWMQESGGGGSSGADLGF